MDEQGIGMGLKKFLIVPPPVNEELVQVGW